MSTTNLQHAQDLRLFVFAFHAFRTDTAAIAGMLGEGYSLSNQLACSMPQ
jgi:hypothetical protein